jgi:hypothetical protein
VTAVEDQQPVETLATDGANEALRDRVRLRRPHRSFDDPDAFAAEDFVKGPAVLAVAVADQESEALLGELEAEVTRLLATQAPLGFFVQPASQTRRLACSMKNKT